VSTPRLLLPVAALLLAGCSAAPHGSASRPPNDAEPGVLAITATDFIDTDGNKYRDTSTVVVYVFPESAEYHLPMRAQGSFEFFLEDPSGGVLTTWRFVEGQTIAARRDLAPGPGFVFDLSLLERGTDRFNIPEAELVSVFTPSDGGKPLRSRTQSPLLVGSVGRSGGVP
jgi:hypothetical protein